MLYLEKMTVKQLREYAADHGISLDGFTKKAEIIKVIETMSANVTTVSEPEVVEAEIIEDEGESTSLEVSCNAGTIAANFDALNAVVDGILADYEGWEPSADDEADVKQCKNNRIYLNSLAKQIDEKRKFYKAEYMRPFSTFEAECTKVYDKIKAVSNRLSDVEKQASEAYKVNKREALREHYEAYAGLLAEVLSYEAIENPKWLNKQPTLEKAKIELEERVNKIAEDWATLQSFELENYEVAEAEFFRTLNLGHSVTYAKKLTEETNRIGAMKAEFEAYNQSPMEPEPLPAAPPAPAKPIPAPIPRPEASLADKIAAAVSVYPESLQQGFLDALIASQQMTNGAVEPYVMAIDQASIEQIQALGKMAGFIGLTGRFKRGTIEQVAHPTYALR